MKTWKLILSIGHVLFMVLGLMYFLLLCYGHMVHKAQPTNFDLIIMMFYFLALYEKKWLTTM